MTPFSDKDNPSKSAADWHKQKKFHILSIVSCQHPACQQVMTLAQLKCSMTLSSSYKTLLKASMHGSSSVDKKGACSHRANVQD